MKNICNFSSKEFCNDKVLVNMVKFFLYVFGIEI